MATKMEITPIKRDFAKTSTPAYAYDSGYCGSNVKSPYEYSFYDSSPSSKFSPKKFLDVYSYCDFLRNPYPQPNFIEDDWSRRNVKRQLEFEDSAFESESTISEAEPLSLSVDKSYSKNKYVPPSIYPVQIFKARLDFLRLLKKRNCERIISDVLSYLSPNDLCRMQCVNKLWKEIVARDAPANRRRQEYLRKIQAERENKFRLPLEAQKRYANLSVLPRLILQEINNKTNFEVSPKKDYNTRFNSFMKESKSYRCGTLMKCPRCNFASKELHGDKYRCTECDFVFCKKCLSPFRNCQCCPMLDVVPSLIVGSKKSKRNLKRL